MTVIARKFMIAVITVAFVTSYAAAGDDLWMETGVRELVLEDGTSATVERAMAMHGLTGLSVDGSGGNCQTIRNNVPRCHIE